jgi:uncharacterized protein with HEPN domain
VKRAERERLDDIAEAIQTIRSEVAAGARTDDRVTRDAVLYNLMVIGEAVKALSAETRALRPEIPWPQIAGLRDLLTQDSFRIDIKEILKIVGRDLAPLDEAVTALVPGKGRHADRKERGAG